MSSRIRGPPSNRESKLTCWADDKPQIVPKKDKPHGSKVSESKRSPAEPSSGAKAEEPKIATSAQQGVKRLFSAIYGEIPFELITTDTMSYGDLYDFEDNVEDNSSSPGCNEEETEFGFIPVDRYAALRPKLQIDTSYCVAGPPGVN
ncbi:uncharacterized protein LOC133729422 [Rosa rugosa]|uniref:uncharacterized protein LOC133729422 n=1 Tax=Rosa rugosa TaxID=74645 RepID=UPI002B4149AB|nr:uncharacterized protein LOC133729422 [Rosa rugosa]